MTRPAPDGSMPWTQVEAALHDPDLFEAGHLSQFLDAVAAVMQAVTLLTDGANRRAAGLDAAQAFSGGGF